MGFVSKTSLRHRAAWVRREQSSTLRPSDPRTTKYVLSACSNRGRGRSKLPITQTIVAALWFAIRYNDISAKNLRLRRIGQITEQRLGPLLGHKKVSVQE